MWLRDNAQSLGYGSRCQAHQQMAVVVFIPGSNSELKFDTQDSE